jgi:hypothetical protein
MKKDDQLARELQVIALMKRAMDPKDPYNGEDIDDDSSEVEND